MINIYGRARRERDDYAIALDGALIALRSTIKRIEASGKCASQERARLDKLQKARAETSFVTTNSGSQLPPESYYFN
jgi:hypothetical protein